MAKKKDYDSITLQVAEPAFGMQLGRLKVRVHPAWKCQNRDIPCCVHNPSDHHMRDWEMNWRSDTGVMERLCPHGVGHPDPDHMAYVRSLTSEHECIDKWRMGRSITVFGDDDDDEKCPWPHLEWQSVHSCDSCCASPDQRQHG